jgi:hypothetical protein
MMTGLSGERISEALAVLGDGHAGGDATGPRWAVTLQATPVATAVSCVWCATTPGRVAPLPPPPNAAVATYN